MRLFSFFKSKSSNSSKNSPSIDLSDFKFLSDDHTRFQNGQAISANNKGAWRGIKIITTDETTFYVTIYNMNGNHPVWGNNIQMSEKQMKVLDETDSKIVLKGFGTDVMGSSFSDYGLSLHKSNGNINKVCLHLHDRNIDIIYEKANNKENSKTLDDYSKNESFENFIERFHSMSMTDKMQIAIQTDIISRRGINAYSNGNTELAIKFFKEALKVMPTNDDALVNLVKCYTAIEEYKKNIKLLNKLKYLNPKNENKIVAYSLLMHILEDFDSDGGAVSPYVLINFMKEKFDIVSSDIEIENVIEKINEPYNRDIITCMIGDFGSMDIGLSNNSYMTSDGTTKSVIQDEIEDVLDWN